MREGIDGDVQFTTMASYIVVRLLEPFLIKVETGEVAGIGIVFQSNVDGVGAVIHSRFEGGQITGGAQQLHMRFPEMGHGILPLARSKDRRRRPAGVIVIAAHSR